MNRINRAPVYTTSDGKIFAGRKEAVDNEKRITRIGNLMALGVSTETAEFIANNAEGILAALDVKETRTRKAVAL